MAMRPKCGQSGYITPAVSRVPNAHGGTKIRNGDMAQLWTKWQHHPCRLGSPHRSWRGQKSQMAIWPKCGQSGHITRATGTKMRNSYAAQMWRTWLHHPCLLRGPQHSWRNKNENQLCSTNVDKVATSPIASQGSPTPMAGTKMRIGYVAQMRKEIILRSNSPWGFYPFQPPDSPKGQVARVSGELPPCMTRGSPLRPLGCLT